VSIRDVQHQPRAHRIIQRALAGARMPHAYLFTGPEGVGREMMAMGLAQILLCQSPVVAEAPAEGEPPCTDACNDCDDCRLVQAGTHPDLFVIHRLLNREHPDSTIRKQKALTLSVDVIRHFLIERVSRRPMRGRAKIFIVREAERLTDAAQNSLLKTLEEPPPDTFLILLTSALDRMLPTTKSRCQPVSFQPLPPAFVAEQLATLKPDTPEPERLFIARHCGGSLGGALRLIEDGLFTTKQAWGDRLAELLRAARGFAPHLLAQPFLADAKAIGKQAIDRDPDMSETDATRVGIQMLLAALAGFYQDAQRRLSGADVALTNADQPQVIDLLSETHSPRQLVAALQQLAQADAAIGRNAALELTAETLFIQLAGIPQGRPGLRLAL
jgi:DNA polymerase-3 subunit delta'